MTSTDEGPLEAEGCFIFCRGGVEVSPLILSLFEHSAAARKDASRPATFS
jgi:hypothetical protein